MEKNENSGRPEVYALRLEGGNWRISRRDFLKAAAIGAAVPGAGFIGGCSPNKPEDTVETATASVTHDYGHMEVSGVDPETGETHINSMPCGSPVPQGSVCTCNCVSPIVDWCLTYGPPTPTVSSHYWHPN